MAAGDQLGDAITGKAPARANSYGECRFIGFWIDESAVDVSSDFDARQCKFIGYP